MNIPYKSIAVIGAVVVSTVVSHADMVDGISTVAKLVLPANVQTQSYPINGTDCLRPAVQMGTGSTTQLTLTLPAASAVPGGCRILFKNGDTYPSGRGMILSGFPSDLNTILWPAQVGEVRAVNGVWVTSMNPGRWKVPQQVTFHIDKTNGSNSNDCLATTTGACQDIQQAWGNAQYQLDNQGTTPILAMACSETHTVALSASGPTLGTNLIQVSPDGNCSFSWSNASYCLAIEDESEIDLRLTQYGSSGGVSFTCNTGNNTADGAVYMHNQTPVIDIEGTPIWTPGGTNDNFLYCDGPCQFTVANGVTQATNGTGNYLYVMSAGGHGTQSGTNSASGSGTANGIFYLYGNALFVRGGSDGSGWASLSSSKVYAGSVVVTNGTTTAGGISASSTGITCTSLTSSC